ncbi:nuclear transport factor 2 family protein [Flavobacterium piscisymbiosum]|uniref:Nuclear transport factor 2 family protein n=1 Tax=Flavobacterium piscisymbiosum TaxID=2893753 RepID=A0ABS8MKA9_9FLAO|nr:nuclear transport factor 2 family protein [Flavobacterium sp. F-30]MCC9065317.1 nuclear transport factor 2 family protein [Flavobacterium sp. F-30]
MKKVMLFVFLFSVLLCNAQKQDVERAIEIFFEGFHQKDTVKMQSVCSSKIILQSISESTIKGNKLSDETAKELYKSIVSIPSTMKFREKIINYNIQIDGTMAHVWAPYEFFVNDKLSHTGVNMFTLFKENHIWKIIYLIDTRRK